MLPTWINKQPHQIFMLRCGSADCHKIIPVLDMNIHFLIAVGVFVVWRRHLLFDTVLYSCQSKTPLPKAPRQNAYPCILCCFIRGRCTEYAGALLQFLGLLLLFYLIFTLFLFYLSAKSIWISETVTATATKFTT